LANVDSEWRRIGVEIESQRWFVRAAIAAGAAWSGLSLISLIASEPSRAIDALFVVPLTLTIGAAGQLHRLQRRPDDRFERLAARALLAVLMAMVPLQLLIAVRYEDAKPFALVAALAFGVSLLAYGIATARVRVLPRWCGVALAISEVLTAPIGLAFSPLSPLSDHGDYTGALAHGLVWLGLAWAATRSIGESVAPHPANRTHGYRDAAPVSADGE
jgi:hypothetical protein